MNSEYEYDKTIEAFENSADPCERALAIAFRFGSIDGGHHKMWVIDQMVRLLAKDNYDRLVSLYENGGEYEWSTGVEP